MTQTIHEVDPPAPFDEVLVSGEKALTRDADLQSPAATTCYFSRYMYFEGGIYQIICGSAGSAQWEIGDDSTSLVRVLATNASQGGATFEIYIPQGVKRFDVTVQNIEVDTPNFFAFSLWKKNRLVYVSTADGWYMDTTYISDADLTDEEEPPLERDMLPVFTLLPNWKSGITERLMWKTDVMTSESDVEQRRSSRVFARRMFDAAFLREKSQRSRLDMFFAGLGRDKFLLPLWHEQFHQINELTTDAWDSYFPTNDGAMREFPEESLYMITDGTPDAFEILKVDYVTDDLVSATGNPSRNWPAGSLVVPLRVARLLDGAGMDNPVDRVGSSNLRFQLEDPEQLAPPDVAYLEYLFANADRGNAITAKYDRSVFNLDYESGKINVTDVSEQTRVSQRMQFKLFSRSSMYAFRQALEAVRGKAVSFYVPTQAADVALLSNITDGATTFDAMPAGHTQYVKLQQQARTRVAFQFNNGDATIYRDVVAVTALGVSAPLFLPAAERFQVSEAMPAINRASIERVCFVMHARLDQDTVEIKHEVNEGKFASFDLTVVSVDNGDQRREDQAGSGGGIIDVGWLNPVHDEDPETANVSNEGHEDFTSSMYNIITYATIIPQLDPDDETTDVTWELISWVPVIEGAPPPEIQYVYPYPMAKFTPALNAEASNRMYAGVASFNCTINGVACRGYLTLTFYHNDDTGGYGGIQWTHHF